LRNRRLVWSSEREEEDQEALSANSFSRIVRFQAMIRSMYRPATNRRPWILGWPPSNIQIFGTQRDSRFKGKLRQPAGAITHTRFLQSSPENASNLRLFGGSRWIRNSRAPLLTAS
jgi:hypothetical protein